MTPKQTLLEMTKYLFFFFYFSAVYQLLCYIGGVSGSVGLRESFYMSFLWLIPIALFPKHIKKISAIIGLVLFITSLFSLGYFILYSQEFSQSVIFIIFESNTVESSEFLHAYFKWWMVPVFLLYAYIPYLMWRRLKPVTINIKSRVFLTLSIVLLVMTTFNKFYFTKKSSYERAMAKQMENMQSAAPWNLILGYKNYMQELASMESLLLNNKKLKPLEEFVDKNSAKASTLVLVIGESTNRQRMSLYGYERETTPNLISLKEKLAVFDNVYSPRPYTIEVLQQALTFADEKNPNSYLTKPNLINIMKQAGYETYWITNQQTQTKRNTMLTTFSKMTDHQVYLNNNRRQNSASYDEVVLEPLREALNDKAYNKKFIIVHLLGAHSRYDYRYPLEFAKFDNEKAPSRLSDDEARSYNYYDNAVYYNDFVVSEIIKSVDTAKSSSAMLYLSDHGEEVFDARDRKKMGRSEGDPTAAMYTIPFLIYANESWKKHNDFDKFKNYTNRLYSSSDLLYTWCDLACVSFEGFEPSRSIINENFRQHAVLIGDPAKKNKLRDLSKEPFI